MRKLLVIFGLLGLFACTPSAVHRAEDAVANVATYHTAQGGTMTVAALVAAIGKQKQHILDDQKQLDSLKLQLKEAQTVKMQHEFYAAAIILGGLLVLCGVLAFWYPFGLEWIRKAAIKGMIVCGIGIALTCVAAKLVPYRTWIEVGIAILTAASIGIYFLAHSHKTISIATLKKEIEAVAAKV